MAVAAVAAVAAQLSPSFEAKRRPLERSLETVLAAAAAAVAAVCHYHFRC